MSNLKLFMLLLGASPPGRHTEQHDIYFGIGKTLKDLLPGIRAFWPEAGDTIHIDGWMEVSQVDGFAITIVESEKTHRQNTNSNEPRLFFLNLGGYKRNEFEEFHYKMLVVAPSIAVAKTKAKESAFYKHTGIPDDAFNKTAESHIDDKYGVDVDDIYEVKDILAKDLKEKFSVQLNPSPGIPDDGFHLGYLQLVKIK